nr:RNA-directed DNA polymerase, eukaryota, reverse transcriptase zinc-binding domain protein [Tanacetum cinerariifolium]
DIKKVLKGFLWCSGDLQKGKAKVSWKIICTPKDQGGLGLKKLDEWNETLFSKQIWKIATKKESLWVKWVNLVKLKGRNFWDVQSDVNDSWMWKVILDLRRKYRPFIMHQIGNGKNVSVWYDKWDVEGPLCSMINKRAIYNARLSDNNTVADMVRDGIINDLVQMNNNNAIRSILRRIAVVAAVYYVWQERNKRIMANEFRSADVLFEIILEYVKLKIMSLKVKLSVQVRKVAKE